MDAAEVRSSSLDFSGSNPTFRDIALPFAQMEIPVIPLVPGQKFPPSGMEGWQERASTSPEQIEAWDAENPAYNVGLVAKPDGFCFLEFDIKRGMKQAAEEAGQPAPETRTHRSGKGFGHYLFRHTERSRRLGNRSANLPTGGEWFSFRANNKYIVGAGSTHPNGNKYSVVRDAEPLAIPDWLCDWIENHSMPERPKAAKGERPLSEDFDFDAFLEHYGIDVHGNGPWYVTPDCPYAGRGHEQSKQTGFFYDGSTLGFHCFAAGCPDPSVGDVIRKLNKSHEPYRGAIWDEEPIEDAMDGFGIDMDEAAEATEPKVDAPKEKCWRQGCQCGMENAAREEPDSTAEASRDTSFEDAVAEYAPETAGPDPLPEPASVAIDSPEAPLGLEFPGGCAMYGKLKEIALRHPRLQLGWLYPSLLAVASALDISDADHNVRANMYVCNLGDVGYGKTACQEAARRSIYLPEGTVVEETPSSDRGLAHMLGEEDTVSRLLLSDEFRAVLQKCAIQSSALPQMICKLWSSDRAGVSDKKGKQACFGKLSILGNLACKDPADFAKMFGAATVSGTADRFIFGLSSTWVKYRPPQVKAEVFGSLKPVRIPAWVWDAKDEWADRSPETRRRLGEHALRVALVTTAANCDREITKECFEAALRFMEWQERIREIYRPGLAETKEAEAYEAVYAALWERLNKQLKDGQVYGGKGAEKLVGDEKERCRLLNFRDTVNKKSYYRKYAGLIDRVKKSMVDNGVIEEAREVELDGNGKEKAGKRTAFIRLQGRIR